jgi:hypothetical protein
MENREIQCVCDRFHRPIEDSQISSQIRCLDISLYWLWFLQIQPNHFTTRFDPNFIRKKPGMNRRFPLCLIHCLRLSCGISGIETWMLSHNQKFRLWMDRYLLEDPAATRNGFEPFLMFISLRKVSFFQTSRTSWFLISKSPTKSRE